MVMLVSRVLLTNMRKGHEYFPIYQNDLNTNINLVGNSANTNTDNSAYFTKNGWTVRPVVDLSK